MARHAAELLEAVGQAAQHRRLLLVLLRAKRPAPRPGQRHAPELDLQGAFERVRAPVELPLDPGRRADHGELLDHGPELGAQLLEPLPHDGVAAVEAPLAQLLQGPDRGEVGEPLRREPGLELILVRVELRRPGRPRGADLALQGRLPVLPQLRVFGQQLLDRPARDAQRAGDGTLGVAARCARHHLVAQVRALQPRARRPPLSSTFHRPATSLAARQRAPRVLTKRRPCVSPSAIRAESRASSGAGSSAPRA